MPKNEMKIFSKDNRVEGEGSKGDPNLNIHKIIRYISESIIILSDPDTIKYSHKIDKKYLIPENLKNKNDLEEGSPTLGIADIFLISLKGFFFRLKSQKKSLNSPNKLINFNDFYNLVSKNDSFTNEKYEVFSSVNENLCIYNVKAAPFFYDNENCLLLLVKKSKRSSIPLKNNEQIIVAEQKKLNDLKEQYENMKKEFKSTLIQKDELLKLIEFDDIKTNFLLKYGLQDFLNYTKILLDQGLEGSFNEILKFHYKILESIVILSEISHHIKRKLLNFNFQAYHLKQQICELKNIFLPLSEKIGVNFEIIVDKSIPDTIVTNFSNFQQIMIILLCMAIKLNISNNLYLIFFPAQKESNDDIKIIIRFNEVLKTSSKKLEKIKNLIEFGNNFEQICFNSDQPLDFFPIFVVHFILISLNPENGLSIKLSKENSVEFSFTILGQLHQKNLIEMKNSSSLEDSDLGRFKHSSLNRLNSYEISTNPSRMLVMDNNYKFLKSLKEGSLSKPCLCDEILILEHDVFSVFCLEVLLNEKKLKYSKFFNIKSTIEFLKEKFILNPCHFCPGLQMMLINCDFLCESKEIISFLNKEKKLTEINILGIKENDDYQNNKGLQIENSLKEIYKKPWNKDIFCHMLNKWLYK